MLYEVKLYCVFLIKDFILFVGVTELRKTVDELQHRINFVSSRLVRQLKRRDRRVAKLQHNSDLVTAILQASSQKRSRYQNAEGGWAIHTNFYVEKLSPTDEVYDVRCYIYQFFVISFKIT